MANIIELNVYQKQEQTKQPSSEDISPSEELSMAIQTLIQQLRKSPLQRIG